MGVVGIANRTFSLLDEDEREDDRNDSGDWGKRHAQRSAGLCRLNFEARLVFEAIRIIRALVLDFGIRHLDQEKFVRN